MALTDVKGQPNVTIKVEEEEEVAEVKGCYIWLSESTQPNFLDETGGRRASPRVKRRRCSVANCVNFLYKTNSPSESRFLTFHKFPKDERARAIWVELCKRTDKFSAKSSFICSDHFKPEDYIKNGIVEHPSERKANRLRPGAIPCLKLPEIPLNGSLIINKKNNISQNEQMESSHNEEERVSDFAMPDSSIRIEDELMESSQEEEEEDSDSTIPHGSSQREEQSNHHLLGSSDVVTISSSEDDDTDEVWRNKSINQNLYEIRNKQLYTLKHKYGNLLHSFDKLKTETNEEIERLNSIIKSKEDEFSRELREVLSVFLKPEEVESVVKQAVW